MNKYVHVNKDCFSRLTMNEKLPLHTFSMNKTLFSVYIQLTLCIVSFQRIIEGMSLEDHVQLTRQMLIKQPGVLYDVLLDFQHLRVPPPRPAEPPVLRWCICDNCVQMPSILENKCCGQVPENCISLLRHFKHYCLDAGYLRIHRQYREEITVLGQLREPGDDNREFRYAAYRHYIFWQYGSLGGGNRKVIPSCCVFKIRETFPDPHGQYRGYTPGL